MWRVWLLFDPRRMLIGLAAFLLGLALLIHFILLSTAKYNWIDAPMAAPTVSSLQLQVVPPTTVDTRTV